MAARNLTSEKLTKCYIQRILDLDQNGPGVNSVIELNPDALEMAKHMDRLRRRGIVLGPMHVIPVVLKDTLFLNSNGLQGARLGLTRLGLGALTNVRHLRLWRPCSRWHSLL